MKTLRLFLQRAALVAIFGCASTAFGQTTTDTTATGTGTGTDTTTTTPATGTGTTSPATGNATGVFIYKLNFEHIEGFNVDFWGGGYVIVPSLGGTGSAILTASDHGERRYSEQANTVAFYLAKDGSKRYSVVSMGGGSAGTSEPMLSMQAFGEIKHTLQINGKAQVNGPAYTLRVQAAKTMHGMAQAARDESKLTTTAQALDGTLGFVEFAEMKLTLDEDETNKANKDGGTVTNGFAQMLLRVKNQGYVSDATTTPGGSTGGGSTGGGTTTTTNPGISTGTGGSTTVNP